VGQNKLLFLSWFSQVFLYNNGKMTNSLKLESFSGYFIVAGLLLARQQDNQCLTMQKFLYLLSMTRS
jgi:hypothetical protein